MNYKQLRNSIGAELSSCLILGDEISPQMHVISAQKYFLQFHGMPICPEAFARLHGVSLDFLERLVQNNASNSDADDAHLCTNVTHSSQNDIKTKFLDFLDNIAEQEGQLNGHFIVLPYSKRQDVLELAKKSKELENLNHHTFNTYWSSFRKNITTMDHGNLCITCGSFAEAIDDFGKKLHNLAPSNPESIILQHQIDDTRFKWKEHSKRAEIQRNQSKKWKEQCFNSQSAISLCLDYASAIQLPAPHHKIFDATRRSKLAVRLGAFVVDNFDQTFYFVHPVFSETSNSIISALYQLLQQLLHPTHRKLFLSMDNHDTNKNNVLFFFLYHLILLGWFDEIEVLYFLEYEGKSRADLSHAHFFNGLRSTPLYSIDDIKLAHHSPSIRVQWLQDIRDWSSFYQQSNVSSKIQSISEPHK